MTPPVNDPETLRRILSCAKTLLLDFDGPICSVFAGIPANVVADQLREVLTEGGHVDLPDDVQVAADPFEVLFYASKLGQDEARYVEAAFRAHEVEAVQSAQPTSSAHDLMTRWTAAGGSLAIVSNNSVAAVRTYLDLHNLAGEVGVISARQDSNTELLKPSPYLLNQAVGLLDENLATCVFVGDSSTDIEAGRAAGIDAIAFANKPEKLSNLIAAGPKAIVTEIVHFLDVL